MKTLNSNLRRSFRVFLHNNGFLPLKPINKNWKSLSIRHYGKKPSKQIIAQFRKTTANQLSFKGGVYAYLDSRGRLLYIGKGKNIHQRIFSHFKEAFQLVGGDRYGIWHKFFSKNTGSLTLLWRIVKHDRQRIALEEIIEDVVRSKFDRKHPRGKRNPGAT